MKPRIELFRTTRRLLFGSGSSHLIGQEAMALKARRVLIVTDPGVVKAGIKDPIEENLREKGIDTILFDRVEADPRYEIVEECTSELKDGGVDLVVGLGGGSSLDIAKCAAIMVTNKGGITDYFGIDLVPERGHPMIAVPTTAGTGSEVTPIAILSDTHERLKKGVISSHLFPDVAILDPELTLGLPKEITASTGMDALIHAIEAYTSVNATDMTDDLAFRAMELLYHNIRIVYANGRNIEAREGMLKGSLLAGMAFANAGVTAVHAFAYPIGAEFHIPHGVANTLMLPYVMEFNILGNLEKFADIALAFGEAIEELSIREAAAVSVEAVRLLTDDLHVPRRLRDFGIKEADLPHLAEGVMKVTRLLDNNPRTIGLENALAIYKKAY